jgi:hypothetical protein
MRFSTLAPSETHETHEICETHETKARRLMKHTNKRGCTCARCAAIASGKTPGQADAEQREWTRAQMAKYGWIVHFVPGGDDQTPTGFNAHTHGLQENYQHADFQIVVPLPDKVAHGIFITLADRVKQGEKFQDRQKVDEVIKGFAVKLIDAVECGRPVLRIILPDPNGKLDLGEINDQYAVQYDKRGKVEQL